MPQPDGRRQVLCRDDHANKTVRLGRVVRGTHLENHLLLVTKVERLKMSTSSQVPDMDLMTVFIAEEQIWLHSVFDHVRRAPFAGEQRVESQVPPKIVMQKLRTAVHLPLAQDLKRFAVEHKNATRAVAIGRTERAHVNAFRSTVNGM